MEKGTQYDARKRAERLKREVEIGIIPEFMIPEIVNLDSSIPQFAREEVKRLAMED